MNFRYAVCIAVSLVAANAYAQPAGTAPATIERVKITDNELSCAQIHAEIGDMDKAVADSKTVEDKEKTSATAAGAANTAAEVAGRTGLFGAFGGVAGALFGQVATQTAAGTEKRFLGEQSLRRGSQERSLIPSQDAVFPRRVEIPRRGVHHTVLPF
jgi:hypothetical protein